MRLNTMGAVGMVVFFVAADASSKLDGSPILRPRNADVGSGVVLTEFDGKTWALVADEDDSSMRVFTTYPLREVATVTWASKLHTPAVALEDIGRGHMANLPRPLARAAARVGRSLDERSDEGMVLWATARVPE